MKALALGESRTIDVIGGQGDIGSL